MQLYGGNWTKRDLLARVGRIEQVGGIRRFSLNEGPEAGVEQLQIRTGTGLTAYISPQRGLDLSLVTIGDVPISWQSPNGDVNPSYYDDRGFNWLRTAAGGLLMTCGLTQVGDPTVDEGEELGLHGRIHHTAAREVSASGSWEGDEYVMRVRGIVEETIIYGTHLRLNRTITSRLGTNRISIEDTVENLGFTSSPLMVLYHFNFGFPLLSEATELRFPSSRLVPNGEVSTLAGYDTWKAPDVDCETRVFFHEDWATDADGWAAATVHNSAFPTVAGDQPVNVTLSWNTNSINHLTEWHMPGAGTHVLGIEPGNCHVKGRSAARADGTLEFLGPGESRSFELYLDINVGE